MKILIFDFNTPYILTDVAEAFREQGHSVTVVKDVLEQSCYDDEKAQTRIEKQIRSGGFNMVHTINYYPVTAKACFKLNVVYTAWQDDSPPNLPLNDTLELSTNRVFFFSKYDAKHYAGLGLEHMYYLPLAANAKRFQKIPADPTRFGADISLVGRLYPSVFPELVAIMSQDQQKLMDMLVKTQLTRHGCALIDEIFTDQVVSEICAHYKSRSESAIQPTKAEFFYACCTQVTHLERLMLLRLSAGLGHTVLYSTPLELTEKAALKEIDIRGPVAYLTEMPAVFKSTKINLNPTLRANRTAIPLRALDIMACSAFMLTSAQEEFDEFFVRDKEYVCYENMEEAYDKIRFYLQHEEERARIAGAGYEKVCADFNYSDRIKTILATCGD